VILVNVYVTKVSVETIVKLVQIVHWVGLVHYATNQHVSITKLVHYAATGVLAIQQQTNVKIVDAKGVVMCVRLCGTAMHVLMQMMLGVVVTLITTKRITVRVEIPVIVQVLVGWASIARIVPSVRMVELSEQITFIILHRSQLIGSVFVLLDFMGLLVNIRYN
jgi:hypothetical protein